MDISSVTRTRTAEGRRIAVAERAVSELDRQLAEWDGQRALIAADDLGRNPHRHVPKAWPTAAESRVAASAHLASPLSPAAVEAECSALWWSGVGKLVAAGVSITVLLSIPLSLVLHALGG